MGSEFSPKFEKSEKTNEYCQQAGTQKALKQELYSLEITGAWSETHLFKKTAVISKPPPVTATL